jgi:hypothetical protein
LLADGSCKHSPEKPIFLCVPSQNGFLDDPPQRHKYIVDSVRIGSPFELRKSVMPLTT